MEERILEVKEQMLRWSVTALETQEMLRTRLFVTPWTEAAPASWVLHYLPEFAQIHVN